MSAINRRELIALAGGAWPIAARSQQVKLIGVLMNNDSSNPTYKGYVTALTTQLRKLGWIEGQNVQVEYRWSAGDPALTRTYAGELVALAPDVIIASSTNNLVALQRLGPATPIIFISVSDPVAQGFVLNMAHPGANITGFSAYEFTIGGKWLDLLKQMVPTITHVGVMFNPQTAPQSKFFMASIESAAPSFGISITAAPVQNVAEIDSAIGQFAGDPNGGLIFPTDSFVGVHRKLFAESAARHRVPAIYAEPEVVREGGLISYRVEIEDQYRQVGVYVDRILKGTKAGDLPVQTPTKYSLAINLKTARTLGIEVPISLLLIADEQIE